MSDVAKSGFGNEQQVLPKLSIITACYNSSRTIRQTIESVLAQRYAWFEHVIVDGGSTDGTIEILKEYPHLHWMSERDNGIYDAMNKGVKAATGDFVGILNSDDWYAEGALSAVGSAFARHPHWEALFGDIIFVDSVGKEIYRRKEACYDYDVLRFSGNCYVIHPTLFVKRSVYETIGYYRDKDFLSSADYEFILQLGRRGYCVGHVREFLAFFRYHEFGQSSDYRIVNNMARESLRIMKEHGLPDGWQGTVLRHVMRAKRQLQKLIVRRSCDLVPGNWILRKHRRSKTSFATNMPMDRL
jgi:glycosyltransferase involved in cell wall biosynthesis